jgi:acyl-CoA thioesterase-1
MTPLLLFTGDSITAGGRRDDPGGLGFGYVRLIADRLAATGDQRRVLNTGIGGDRVRDLRARWSEDVLAHHPQTLSVFVGINDTWRRYDSGQVTTAEQFESDYVAMLETVSVQRLVIVEPFVLPVTAEQREWGVDLGPKRAIVADVAARFAAAFVPLHSILTLAAGVHGAAALAADGVHPTPLGATLIADAIATAV